MVKWNSRWYGAIVDFNENVEKLNLIVTLNSIEYIVTDKISSNQANILRLMETDRYSERKQRTYLQEDTEVDLRKIRETERLAENVINKKLKTNVLYFVVIYGNSTEKLMEAEILNLFERKKNLFHKVQDSERTSKTVEHAEL